MSEVHIPIEQWTDDRVNALLGSWLMLSEDRGATWGAPTRVPVSTPHGPVLLKSGDLLYLGKLYGKWSDMLDAGITAARSRDGGHTWEVLGQVPAFPGTDSSNYHEPHVIELPSGRLIGVIRIEDSGRARTGDAGVPSFSLMQTESDDGGRTWTTARPLGFHGSPPHLLRHSSGVLVCSYGYRQSPCGQRVAFSRDDGATWEHDWIVRDDGPDGDLGYPSTVELADGSLFTVCYQKAAAGEKCSLLWSRWRLPGYARERSVWLELGEPVTVALASPEVRGWGPYQFPGLARLPDGRIQVSYHVEADSATAYGLPPARAVASDEGHTWKLLPREGAGGGTALSWGTPPLRLPNGDLLSAKQLRSRPVAEFRLPEQPLATFPMTPR